jgi:hypothetical protein
MIESPKVNLTEENPVILQPTEPVKNILENIEYVEPNLSLPVPEGMCFNCDIENNN